MAPKGRKRKAKEPEAKAVNSEDVKTNGGANTLPKRLRGEGSQGPGPRVVIEHWRNADAVSQALRRTIANVVVVINPETPRRNSFEVSLVKEDGRTVELWSGIKKGPPRKLKFPEPEKVADMLKSSLV
ncbi:Selenoprotein H [Chelonia mydas]|uniref:Selenoprotein H n=1 Tax=Chelonia mydas TaxID=8469 RepID=M7B676_CHEMY|nr:Selenoprotein H [Chelonia mydas]